MTDCPLQQLDNGKWWCEDCDEDKLRLLRVKARRNCRLGWKPRSIRDRRPPCVDETLAKELDPAADKLGIKPEHIKHYAQALVKWRAAGYPTRTQEEVDQRVAICQGCESFTGSRCRNCGCGVSGGKMAVFNKARMATENCLEGKWPTRKPCGQSTAAPPSPAQ